MREILVVNPRAGSAKQKSIQRKGKKMAAKNPKLTKEQAKALATRAARQVGMQFAGINFKQIAKDIPWNQAGMWAATWAAKRFGSPATQTDPTTWTWDSYLKGALGGVGAGILCNMIRKGKGKVACEAAINLMLYKAGQNELVTRSQWATEQFGADDEYVPTEYLLTGDEETPMAYDQEGNLYPADDRHRLPEVGDALEPLTPLGDALEPLGPLGQDPWSKAFIK